MTEPSGASQTRWPRPLYLGLLGLLLIAGAAVRLYGIDAQIVIDDEWHALNAVQRFDAGWIFTHFAQADISIPLALLYELQYHLYGLDEVWMRWPMLVAGIAAIVLLPWILRPWLSPRERLLLAALIAISPFLVYYSRFARPYMLLALLEPAALLLAWRWWTAGRATDAAGWAVCAALAAWLNAPALAVVTAPFAWFGLLALWRVRHPEGRAQLFRLFLVGLVMLVPLGILLGPPLLNDYANVAAKAGQHLVHAGTLDWALSLAAGSGSTWVYRAVGLLALLGAIGLFRRDPAFARFLGAVTLLAMIAVSLVGAAYVREGPVFLRYLVGLLPFFLACVALGVSSLADGCARLLALPPASRPMLAATAIPLLALAGPMTGWPLRDSQFVTHLNFHFHYDPTRNAIVRYLDQWYVEEPYLAEIAAAHPDGDAVIVYAPWHLESFYNALVLDQAVHGQRLRVGFVGGVCGTRLYGEVAPGNPGMRFENFVFLEDLLTGRRSADYLVLRKRHMDPDARPIELNFQECERRARDAFGEPWRESDYTLVFSLRRGA